MLPLEFDCDISLKEIPLAFEVPAREDLRLPE